MIELLGRGAGELAAARLAGAHELVEGELHHGPGGARRLELRRIDVATGRVRGVHVMQSTDDLDLARRAAATVASALGLPEPDDAPLSSNAVAAHALVERGLRAREPRTGLPLFLAALDRDSTFALAALYAGGAAQATLATAERAGGLMDRALSLARYAPDRDQLLIRATVKHYRGDTDALQYARALRDRHSRDPSGPFLVGRILSWKGNYLEAIAFFREAIALGRAQGEVDAIPPCWMCAAYDGLIDSYQQLDSFPASLRVAREWARLQPRNPQPVASMATIMDVLERGEEATAVWRRFAELNRSREPDTRAEARRALRRGDFADADARLGRLARSRDTVDVVEAHWLHIIGLRARGRLREALAEAHDFRRLRSPLPGSWRLAETPEAVVLQESGEPRRAAAIFDSLQHRMPAHFRPRVRDGQRAWVLTLVASALAEAGDTTRLARLADSARVSGMGAGYGRDEVTHHHVRGLLLRARGDLAGAEEAFRAAMFSRVGYTRSNLELARVLLARDRPADAVTLLRSALHAPLDGTAYYVTRTELQAFLGEAFDAAGQRDSAAAYYRKALAAWAGADPVLRPRVHGLRVRLTKLGWH